MKKNLLNILKCVKENCCGSLEYAEDTKKSLTCEICNHQYQYIHNIPILMADESFKSFNKRYWDKEKEAESYTDKYNKYLINKGNPWGQYTHDSEIYGIKRLLDDYKFNAKDKIIIDCGSGNGRFLSIYNSGAMWSSWPINGNYKPYEAINWANKFFTDLINLNIKNKN